MRTVLTACSLVFVLLSGCGILPNGASINHAQAQSLSDQYMADLVADRVDLSLDKMGATFVESAGGRVKMETAIRDLFNYCGRPLERELRHEETGFFATTDGRRLPMRMFVYSGKTTQNPKGVCFFSVRVVEDKAGIRVLAFGPLKLVSGKFPAWAR
jgi:hypothetical protein